MVIYNKLLFYLFDTEEVGIYICSDSTFIIPSPPDISSKKRIRRRKRMFLFRFNSFLNTFFSLQEKSISVCILVLPSIIILIVHLNKWVYMQFVQKSTKHVGLNKSPQFFHIDAIEAGELPVFPKRDLRIRKRIENVLFIIKVAFIN